MKLILAVTLIWILSSTDPTNINSLTAAEALQCLNNNADLQPCGSADETCGTTAYQDDASGHVMQYIIRSCVPSSLCTDHDRTFSANVGFGTMAAFVHCCSTDGCNNQTLPYPDQEAEENGLECVSCTFSQGSVCNETLRCMGVQDRCINGYLGHFNSSVPVSGCASASVCEVLSHQEVRTALADRLNFSSAPTCCGGSFCNSARAVSLSVVPLLLALIALVAALQ